jgi:Sulfotransferase family
MFIHIPKAAGTSFREILRRVYQPEECVFIYSHDAEHLESLRTAVTRAQAISGHVSFGIHEFYGIRARYVGFLRNPLDRVVSLYLHQARLPDNELHDLIADGMTLKDILRSEQFPEYNNHMTRMIAGVTSSDPIYGPRFLQRPEVNLVANFDFVGTTEGFKESLAALGKMFGWGQQPIPRLNVNPERLSFVVDDETKAEILRRNALGCRSLRTCESRATRIHDAMTGRRKGLIPL